jgi:hypothetical protein|tara:strand:+ start:257 stop:436 length:180 start_codon:yes stop_codon:yes gene_type:complete
MLWDLVVGLCIFAIFIGLSTLPKKLSEMRKDIDDLITMVRIFRYESMKKVEEDERKKKK